MPGQIDHFDRAAEQHVALLIQPRHAGMLVFFGAEDFARLALLVVVELLFDGHDRQDVSIGFREGDALAVFDRVGEIAIDRQRDRNRPDAAVGQVHRIDDAVVVGFAQEAGQRGVSAVAEQTRHR